jgi:hypothetical protein
VSKFDADGNLIWTHTFLGTASDAHSVSADGFGNVYITGQTTGQFAGTVHGPSDAILAKISDVDVPEPTSLMLLLIVTSGAFVERRRVVRTVSKLIDV